MILWIVIALLTPFIIGGIAKLFNKKDKDKDKKNNDRD